MAPLQRQQPPRNGRRHEMGALQQGRRHEMPPLQRKENGRRLSFLQESMLLSATLIGDPARKKSRVGSCRGGSH